MYIHYTYKLYIYVNHAFKILALLHFSQNIFRKLVALTQSTLFTLSDSARWGLPWLAAGMAGSKASEFGSEINNK